MLQFLHSTSSLGHALGVSKENIGHSTGGFHHRAKSNPALLKVNAIVFIRSSTEPQHLHCPP